MSLWHVVFIYAQLKPIITVSQSRPWMRTSEPTLFHAGRERLITEPVLFHARRERLITEPALFHAGRKDTIMPVNDYPLCHTLLCSLSPESSLSIITPSCEGPLQACL